MKTMHQKVAIRESSRNGRRFAYLCWGAQIFIPAGVLVYGWQRLSHGPPVGRFLLAGMITSAIWIPLTLLALRVGSVRRFSVAYARQAFMCVIILLSSVAIAEAALRLAYYGSLTTPLDVHISSMRIPHPTRGWQLKANEANLIRCLDYALIERTNSKGLHDVEHEYKRDPGVFRILVLGDSFMEAYSVPLEESLTRRLSAALADRRVEVINLGVGGYGTLQELIYLREEGLKYHPDLVLLGFYAGNDIYDNNAQLSNQLQFNEKDHARGKPTATLGAKGELVTRPSDYEWAKREYQRQIHKLEQDQRDMSIYKKSLIRQMARKLLKRQSHKDTHPPWDPNVWQGAYLREFSPEAADYSRTQEEYEHMWRQAWDTTIRLLAECRRTTREAGAEFLVFTVPDGVQVGPQELDTIRRGFPTLKFDVNRVHARLIEACAKQHIDVFDVVPAFRAVDRADDARLFHHKEDRHWNSRGHEVAAQALLKYLDDRKLLPAANAKQ